MLRAKLHPLATLLWQAFMIFAVVEVSFSASCFVASSAVGVFFPVEVLSFYFVMLSFLVSLFVYRYFHVFLAWCLISMGLASAFAR